MASCVTLIRSTCIPSIVSESPLHWICKLSENENTGCFHQQVTLVTAPFHVLKLIYEDMECCAAGLFYASHSTRIEAEKKEKGSYV